jgi:hypothetical protein
LPPLSTATQRPLLGQDTPFRELVSTLVPSTLVTVQAVAPPVGLLEVTTLPLPSTATQSLLLEQDTPDRVPPYDGWWSMSTGVAQVNEGLAVGFGDAIGDGLWEGVAVGDALGGREACAFGSEEPPQAARIRTTARTAILM